MEQAAPCRNGPSPRVWGIRSSSVEKYIHATVHPHACGEYFPAVLDIVFANRSIPTRVGNTNYYGIRLWSMPVHPHACGEYLI